MPDTRVLIDQINYFRICCPSSIVRVLAVCASCMYEVCLRSCIAALKSQRHLSHRLSWSSCNASMDQKEPITHQHSIHRESKPKDTWESFHSRVTRGMYSLCLCPSLSASRPAKPNHATLSSLLLTQIKKRGGGEARACRSGGDMYPAVASSREYCVLVPPASSSRSGFTLLHPPS